MPNLYQPYLLDEPRTSWAYVTAVMFLPRGDLAAHESIMVPLMYDMIDFEAIAPSASVEGVLALAKALRDSPRLEKRMRRQAHGVLAGVVLGTVLRASEHGYPEFASVARLLRCASQAVQKRVTRGASIESLEAIWRKYRRVSHLWAGLANATSLKVSQTALLEFLACAEELRCRGETHKPPHRQQTFLDPDETWKVAVGVRLPSVAVSLPR